MGQVYEAEETQSGRRVAMKILNRGIGDEEERQRFLTEGRIAASLSHPNLVYVFGPSEVQGLPVIAMELAPAGTLKDLVVDGALLAPGRRTCAGRGLRPVGGLARADRPALRAGRQDRRHARLRLARAIARRTPGRAFGYL